VRPRSVGLSVGLCSVIAIALVLDQVKHVEALVLLKVIRLPKLRNQIPNLRKPINRHLVHFPIHPLPKRSRASLHLRHPYILDQRRQPFKFILVFLQLGLKLLVLLQLNFHFLFKHFGLFLCDIVYFCQLFQVVSCHVSFYKNVVELDRCLLQRFRKQRQF
jgi:hypothetical protein